MKVSVIRPNFTVDQDTKRILITDFIDETGTTKTIEEIVNITEDTRYYCYAYQPSIAAIEEWWPETKRTIPFTNAPYYTGSSRKQDTFIPEHFVERDSVKSDVKIFYNGHVIWFRDVEKWVQGLNVFRTNQEEHTKVWEILCYLEKNYISLFKRNFKTLASLSREFIGDPSRFCNPKRDYFLKEIERSYVGAYNYIAKTDFVWEHLYHFDVKSMYPYMLMNRYYPDPNSIPVRYDGFVNVEGPAIYHISQIIATVKKGHFPTIFCEDLLMSKMGIADKNNLNWTCTNESYGWITSVDYEMLKRDYNIELLYIDTTWAYRRVILGSELFGKKIIEIFNEKEAATDPFKRAANKLLINTYSGSIGMRRHVRYKIDHLTNPQKKIAVKERKKVESLSPYDISAFMTAYARQYITELALEAGLDNVACVNVDAIAVINPEPLMKYVGKRMGDLEMDREMFNAYWWRINTYEWQNEEGEWEARIAGLPNAYYKHGKTTYLVPKILWNSKEHYFYKRIDMFTLNLEEDF